MLRMRLAFGPSIRQLTTANDGQRRQRKQRQRRTATAQAEHGPASPYGNDHGERQRRRHRAAPYMSTEVQEVARPQVLYLGDKGQLSYEAIGNAEFGTGQKGSIALWYHPVTLEPRNSMVELEVDPINRMSLKRYKQDYIWRVYSNGSYRTIQTPNGSIQWRHVVATWDFSGGPGAGVLRLYIDGVEAPESPVTNASAPVGPPAKIKLGPGVDNIFTRDYAVYDQFIIWNDVMSADQVADLHEEGRLHVPVEADGTGDLLLRASWDGQYDAEVAEGSGIATPECAADEYCRLDIGGREIGKRFAYRVGMPAHDGSEDDRVPLYAVLERTQHGVLTVNNTDEWAEFSVDATNEIHPSGAFLAPWITAPEEPMILRVSAHLVSQNAPVNLPIGLGAVSYFHGTGRRIVCGEESTASKLYAASLMELDDYWAGAEVSMITGPAGGQKLRALTNSFAERSLTLEGELSDDTPEGAVAVVEFPKRIEPYQTWGPQHRLECDFSQINGDLERFTTVACATGGSRGYVCVDEGRVQDYADTLYREVVFFGKREEALYPDWQCTLLIERIEMDGPAQYQSTDKLDDTFMVIDPETGESTKVWRSSSVNRVTRAADQYADPVAALAEFTEPGTWREELQDFPSWMEYDPVEKCLRAPIVGRDGSGVERVGYILGTWNEDTGRVEWTDDPHANNPVFELDSLRAMTDGKGTLYNLFGFLNGVFQTVDGTWAMVFLATVGNPDGMVACALTGAEDRYSFDPAIHFHPEDNPIKPFVGGRDKVVPEGGGIGFFGNRDCEHRFVENHYEQDPSRRFWGYARTKTELHQGDQYHLQLARPLSCAVTGDFKNLRKLPWRNTALVPHYAWFHYPHPEWYSASTLGLVVDDGGVTYSHVNLYVADDGVNLQKPFSHALIERDTPPFNSGYLSPSCVPVQLGKKRIYWYRGAKSGMDHNMATIRLDGETLYAIEDGETAGLLDTCELRRPEGGWSELKLNVNPKDGTVRVGVIDTATEQAVAGFGSWDCGAIGEGIAERVTWDGVGLSELGIETIRLRFRLERPTAGAASPELYAWRALPPTAADLPWCKTPQVEGKINPTSVADPSPELSWEYGDPEDRPQSAFHALVASSEELLAQNVGDLWDSGVTYSDATEVAYNGAELASETTYFWKVRVRNSEGAWSEEW